MVMKRGLPKDYWRSHLVDAEDENVEWLMARGVQLEEACRRAGVTVQAYTKRHEPARARTS